jgi:hypothetical protein
MITYNAELHSYCDDIGPLAGVTTVIKDMGLSPFSGSPRSDALEAAALRGTYVHDACQMYDEDDLDMAGLDSALDPYVLAWSRFRDESGFTPKLIEYIVHDPIRRFAGRIDRVGVMGTTFSNVLLDIKTGEVYPDAGIQLAAYLSCLPVEIKITKRIAVKLSNDGTYRVHEFKSKDDLRLFHAAVQLWHWRKREGLI